jgi:UDP-N-acetyl-2-amino-2-deoxyglucuronate dehydrogenase
MIRFGLVGCGRIAHKHSEAIQIINSEAKLVAVCDVQRERADGFGKKCIASVYYDYKEFLKHEFDVVVITSPSALHPDLGMLAAKAGKHVITEKPIGISLEKIDELIQTCDRYKRSLFVVKQNRLNPTMKLLKNAIKKNRFGRIYMAHANVFWQRPQAYYDMDKWRGTWEFDGGSFMNQASHYLDAMYWLIGEVESVMAITGTLGRNIETEDCGSALLKYRNGAIGSINVSMLTYPKNFEGSITVLGEKGTVKIGGIALNKIEKWEFSEYDDDDKVIESSNYEPTSVYGQGHIAYYQNVIKVLTGKTESEIDGRVGRKTVEIILGIYKSAKEGIRVPLPL